jgi:hypothetical protein
LVWIVDPRGIGTDGALLFLNCGSNRILALDGKGCVVRESGAIAGLNPGGGDFGPDGRYCVGLCIARSIMASVPTLDGPGETVIPSAAVPFPRGFAFGQVGTLFLASGRSRRPRFRERHMPWAPPSGCRTSKARL